MLQNLIALFAPPETIGELVAQLLLIAVLIIGLPIWVPFWALTKILAVRLPWSSSSR